MQELSNSVENASCASIDATTDLRKKYLELGAFLKEAPFSLNIWIQYLNAAVILNELDDAVETVLACISRVPEPETDFLPLGRMLYQNGWVSLGYKIYQEILRCDKFARQTHSEILVYKLHYGHSDNDAFEEYCRWNDRFVRPLVELKRPAKTDKDPNRRIRIGFVSIDFGGEHSLNRAIAPWFTYRNRISHEYVCYSSGRDSDPVHPVFLDNSDEFLNIGAWSDAELNDRIRADKIDILVDMTGHMEGNRLLAYAPKPAPIIVSWVGLGIATGVEVVDYFLADEHRVPKECLQDYRESVVVLPGSGLPWMPPSLTPDIEPPPIVRNGNISFGNLSRLVKFQPETIALWAEVLKAIPNSTFMFKNLKMAGNNEARLASLFENVGVSKERLIFRPWSDQVTHLDAYNDIDVMLDSTPEQGGISGLEAIWMGVPIISYEPFKYRCHAGSRILKQVGMPDLVTTEKDQFVEIAKFFAQRPDILISLRKSLRTRLSESVFCDGPKYMRGVERAFAEMWRRYCANLPPTHFAVPEAEESPIQALKSNSAD